MSFTTFLSFVSTLICFALALFALSRDRRSFAHVTFAVGMIVLAAQQGITGMGAMAIMPEEVLRWRYLRTLVGALIPGIWLLFSLTFARTNYTEYLNRWKWTVIAVFVVPLVLVIGFRPGLFTGHPLLEETSTWLVRIGWSGSAFHVFFLLSTVLILANLEGTLRAFTGSARWKIKFMLLGIGCLFAVRIYTSSQVILFSAVNTALDAIESGGLWAGAFLLAISFRRSPVLNVDLYVSQKVLYHSVTLLVIGLYLLAVGGLSHLGGYFGGNHSLVFAAFIVFIGLLGLLVLLLADQFRENLKRAINRNFHRPRYDHRAIWMRFSRATASILKVNDLCGSIASMVSETFGVPSVSIYLLDDSQKQLSLHGSTVFSRSERQTLRMGSKGDEDFLHALRKEQNGIDFERPPSDWLRELQDIRQKFPIEGQVRYCASLLAGGRLMGLMTLNDRITKEAFSPEDFDLLKAICDQTATNLLNLHLSQELVQAKQLEAFQSFSACFLHDLKNLASTLSMTVKNLPKHFDDPEFRKDALRAISGSVEKINSVCQSIAVINKKLEVRRTKADLNRLVAEVRNQLNGSLKAAISLDLHPLPELLLDTGQIEKVLINLLLNANDATTAGGEIQVSTGRNNGWITLSVSDNGCGMAQEFITGSLFKPFQTSKEQGLGIGLFHSKKIVESHQGKIEVESEVGKGSTFRVMLPLRNT